MKSRHNAITLFGTRLGDSVGIVRQLGMPYSRHPADCRQCGVFLRFMKNCANPFFIHKFIVTITNGFWDRVFVGDATFQMEFQPIFGFLFEFLECFAS